MPHIKFSQLQKKLLNSSGEVIETAKLLLVSVIPMEDISPATDFIEYETDNKVSIPFSEFYLLLIFLRPDGEIFTTVRPRHSIKKGELTKEQYYRGLVGSEFEIIING